LLEVIWGWKKTKILRGYAYFRKVRKKRTTGLTAASTFFSKVLEKSIMIKVLVAEDHAIVRQAILSLLERAGDIRVIATASDGQEAVSKAVVHCPHVALVDVSMPVMDGLEATKQICSRCPRTRVLMVTGHSSRQYVENSLRAGAVGYLLKDAASHELVAAVRTVYQGKRYFSRQISELVQIYIE
jgi:DNA-binding NarL/FixJ family response regulator